MSYSNHYKSKVDTSLGKKKQKEKEKKDRKGFGFSGDFFRGIGDFFRDERTQQVVGLFFILLSGVLLLSLTSYLFTWRIDQDELFKLSWLFI